MSYLLDTNVISEVVRRYPDERVVAWLQSTPNEALYLSVLSLGEIRKGVESLEPSIRRERLRVWLESDLPQWFEGRMLAVDRAVADRWGRLMVRTSRAMPSIDSILAATALEYDLRVVTRNTRDFEFAGLECVNPWMTDPLPAPSDKHTG